MTATQLTIPATNPPDPVNERRIDAAIGVLTAREEGRRALMLFCDFSNQAFVGLNEDERVALTELIQLDHWHHDQIQKLIPEELR